MSKEIVHYMHFNKLWYYWLDEYESKKYWRKLNEDDNIHLVSEEVITERQCKEKLQNMYPDNKIMKAIPFHYSPSNSGSRPIKCTVDRKGMAKEKVQFRKELENFVGGKTE